MKYWFVIHDLLAYSQHKDMIGNVVKATGVKQPKHSSFAEMCVRADAQTYLGLMKHPSSL